MRESALKGGNYSCAETLSPFFAGFQISMSESMCDNYINMVSDSDEHGFSTVRGPDLFYYPPPLNLVEFFIAPLE